MKEPTLFDSGPFKVKQPKPVKLTAGQRLKARQAEKSKRGRHPLAGVARTGDLLLGPDGETCGGCEFRSPQAGGSYPKCRFGAHEVSGTSIAGRPYTVMAYPRANSSVTSDCRKGWPACRDFKPKEADRG